MALMTTIAPSLLDPNLTITHHYTFGDVQAVEYSDGSLQVIGAPPRADGSPQDAIWVNTTYEGKNYTALGIELFLRHEEYPRHGRYLRAMAILAGFLTLAGIIFTIARLYIRRVVLKRFFLDDWLIATAMIVGVASTVCYILMLVSSMQFLFFWLDHDLFDSPSDVMWSTHLWDEDLPYHYIFNAIQSALARLSIFATFHRLSISDSVRNIRLLLKIAMVVTILSTLVVTWLTVDPCWPPRPLGSTRNYLVDKCLGLFLPMYGMMYRCIFATSVFNAVADLFTFALPFMVFRMQKIAVEKRKQLYALFGFGLGVFAISLARSIVMLQLMRQNPEVNTVRTKVAFNGSQLFGVGEANAVVIGACLPIIAKSAQKHYGRILGCLRRKHARGETTTASSQEQIKTMEEYKYSKYMVDKKV